MAFTLLSSLEALGAEHENTTTEAVLDGASYTFPANFWRPGKVVHWEAIVEVIDNNSTDTLTPVVYLGTATLTTAVASFGAVDVADTDLLHLTGTITCHAVDDSSGVLISIVRGSDLGASGASTGLEDHYSRQTSVDTTASWLLEIGVDWSVAHADNEVACAMFNVIEVTG